MSRFLLAAAALSVIAACSASASVTPPAASAALATAPVSAPAVEAPAPVQHVSASYANASRMTCSIRTHSTANGLLIEAVGSSGHSMSGEYNLVITKSGAGGSSDVTQGGPFNAAAGRSLTLGSAEIGMDRGDHYHAVLTIRDADGVVCREERRS